VAAVFCGWAAAAVVHAQTPGFQQPAAAARLEPGTNAEVAWTLELGERPGFDEMELVLSVDGGRTFPLRVTRDVSPATRRLSWRVPALPTEHARLALRAGSKEEPESETICIVGPEFVIAARPADSLEELFWVRGEWRTRESLGSTADLPEPNLFDQTGDQMQAARAGDRAAEPPTPTALASVEQRRPVCIPAMPPSRKTASDSRVSAALFTPLRQ
jgi:hypothetical protein